MVKGEEDCFPRGGIFNAKRKHDEIDTKRPEFVNNNLLNKCTLCKLFVLAVFYW